MTQTYSINATYEHDDQEIELLIYFTFLPGSLEQGPSYASGGQPAEPAEVELHHVERREGVAWVPTRDFDEWAAEYLHGDGYAEACEEADARSGPDPDAAYDRDRDDRMMGVGRYAVDDGGDW